jgi:hypothetical protein
MSWYLVRFIRAISYYVFGTSTKRTNLASGCGINNKSKHYPNSIMWVMFPTNIHRQRVVIAINFGSSLLWRLCQILNYPFELKFLNLLGSSTKYNNLLVLKNIIFNRGPNMAPWRFRVRSHDNCSIKWISVLIHISGSPLLMLIPTSCYSAIGKITRPSRSILWNCLPWPTEGTSPPFCYNTLIICFFILLVNIVVIFNKPKWLTCTIKIFLMFF